MTMIGTQPQYSTALPQTLNVQKFAESRASELKSLQTIVANRLDNDFRSQRNKRRRTTGYKNRGTNNRSKRQRVSNDKGLKEAVAELKAVPRRIRRRDELKQNPQTGFVTSGDGTKRLRTHVWHAKRFTMTKLWGFHLPLHLQGRGRGSRALLKKLKNGVLVHDASYYSAVQLEGPQDLLLSVLNNLFVPSPSTYSENTFREIISGVKYGSAMLHHAGDPFSPAVAPVTYMWRPVSCTEFALENQKANANDEQHKVESFTPSRQLWVWIHPAAFREGYDALQRACGRQKDVNGCLVNCISLEDQLAKIELMGEKTFELLQKILHPVTCFPVNSEHLRKCSATGADGETQHKNKSILENADDIATSGVISLTVKDPRTLTKEKDHIHEGVLSGILNDKENEINGITRMSITDARLLSSSFTDLKENLHMHEDVNLWDASKGVCSPVEESILCHEKHHQRLQFCRISDKSSRKPDASVKEQYSKFCPALLLKNNNQGGSFTRWSIILPLSWVKAFWVPLVSNGGHAIGLREKHWISCEVGLPYYPLDFPDSNGYSSFMAMKATTSDQDADLRPSWMRSLKVPIPPPWNSIRLAFDKVLSGDAQIHAESHRIEVNKDSKKNLDSGKCDTSVIGDPGAFQGCVARTSYTLNHFLDHKNGNELLLFPRVAGQKIFMSKAIGDEKMLDQEDIGGGNPSTYSCGKMCFLRVLLHAYKEGVFEEGAVVCAPHFEDILSWTLRSNEGKGLIQLPQSSLRSYFVQETSGEWVLQTPEDAVANESYRCPIGFVTTGFVRGSKKPVAVGHCEATMLGRLRKEQWKTIEEEVSAGREKRRELYVLVRNMKSTAYRLALATIVLEAHVDDVECM